MSEVKPQVEPAIALERMRGGREDFQFGVSDLLQGELTVRCPSQSKVIIGTPSAEDHSGGSVFRFTLEVEIKVIVLPLWIPEQEQTLLVFRRNQNSGAVSVRESPI